MYDFMKDEGALEYGIRDVILMYSRINGTSKREAVLAANEIIKKISKEVQQEEDKEASFYDDHAPKYVDTDSIKTIKKQAYDDFQKIMNTFVLDYIDILLFTSTGVTNLYNYSIEKEENKKTSDYLLALHFTLEELIEKYENQGFFVKKGGEE